jgi:hypothetical protein
MGIIKFILGDSAPCIYCGKKAWHVNTSGLPYYFQFHIKGGPKEKKPHEVCKSCRKMEIEYIIKTVDKDESDVDIMRDLLLKIKEDVLKDNREFSKDSLNIEPTDADMEILEMKLINPVKN